VARISCRNLLFPRVPRYYDPEEDDYEEILPIINEASELAAGVGHSNPLKRLRAQILAVKSEYASIKDGINGAIGHMAEATEIYKNTLPVHMATSNWLWDLNLLHCYIQEFGVAV